MLTILYFSFWIISSDPTPSYEQLTVDYFFESIWNQKYKGYKSIEFGNKTDSSIYVGHIHGCRGWSEDDIKKIEDKKPKGQIQLNSKSTNVSIKKKSKSKRIKLFIGTKVQLGEAFVVQIEVYKPFEFVDHYFIKFNKDGKIIETCEFNEVI